MSKYMILIILPMLFSCLLAGCQDPSVEFANANKEVESIKNKAERASERHKQYMLRAQSETGNIVLRQRSGVTLFPSSCCMTSVNHNAADGLLDTATPRLPKLSPVLVASFVNLDALNESSTFGRVVAEQITSRLKQRGYTIIEMKLRTNVFIKEGSGEFLLSRELTEISTKHDAQAVVVGTYAVAADKVYLTTRLVNAKDSCVISSYDYAIPISDDVLKLLLKDKGMGWLL